MLRSLSESIRCVRGMRIIMRILIVCFMDAGFLALRMQIQEK